MDLNPKNTEAKVNKPNLDTAMGIQLSSMRDQAHFQMNNSLVGKKISSETMLEKEPIAFTPSGLMKNKHQSDFILSFPSSALNNSNTNPSCVNKISLPISIEIATIHSVFKYICDQLNFQVIEDNSQYVIAIYKTKFSLIRFAKKCLCCFKNFESSISVAKLTSKIDSKTFTRKILINHVYGSKNNVAELGQNFVNFLGKKLSINQKKDQNESLISLKNSTNIDQPNNVKQLNQMMVDEESRFDEGQSYYEFVKILSNSKYSVGKLVSDYFYSFPLQYKNSKESALLLPQPLEGILTLIKETVSVFIQQHNLGKSLTSNLVIYCKPSVEKFVFGKLYEKLYSIYSCKFEEIDFKFREAQKKCKNKLIIELMNDLEIPENFRLLSKKNNIEICGYSESISCLNKLEIIKIPSEKVGCIMNMHSMMKAAVLENSQGKVEVISMDDQLPIFIILMALSSLSRPATELGLIEDYVNLESQGTESVFMIITTLNASIDYIINTLGKCK